MNLQEFNNEFMFRYDAASNGGPDLNSYEKSICLTQAVSDIIEAAYEKYETNERSKRILAPLLRDHDCIIQQIIGDLTNSKCYLVSLPSELHYVIREEAKLANCVDIPKIVDTDLDHLQDALINPFRKPNKRKILKVEESDSNFKIYSQEVLSKYKIKYLINEKPIILANLASDPNLQGNETIAGLNVETNTELPSFIHADIIDRAVILAIKAARENSLQSQVQIK